MIIWLLTIFLLGLWAWVGKTSGAIRMSISLVGLILGACFAFPLGKLMKSLAVSAGLTNPLLQWVVPPLVVFVLFLVIFGVISHFVHRKIEVHFKYKEADDVRMYWERMNERLGACVGLLTGAVYSILLGLVVYVAGYWTSQLASPNENPPGLKFLNSAHEGLRPSGMEKIAAALDKMPPAWYEVADVLGLIYQNPESRSRLAEYPISLALLEQPVFQQLANDTELINLVKNQGNLAEFIKHPKVQAVITNATHLKQLEQIDLKDLSNYVATGRSLKFDGEKILGRWQLHASATSNELKKKNPSLTVPQLKFIRQMLKEKMSDVILLALADHQVVLKGSAGSLEVVAQNKAGGRGGTPPAAPKPGGQPGGPPAAGEAVAGSGSVIVQGTWKGEGIKYQLTFNGTQNEEVLIHQVDKQAMAVLVTTFYGGALVFRKDD